MGCCCSKSEVAPSRSDEKYLVVNQPKKVETNDRYNKIGISTIDPSLLIKGYENESVSSLEEALQPFNGKISHLNEQIQEAKSKCHYPSEHNLTHDESAALYLYLNQDKGGDTVYNNLQQSWNTNNRTQMEPWFKYLKLLKNALNKLPDVKSEVYQGISYDKSIENILRTKNTSLYTCMGLSSPSIEELKKNLQNKSDSKMLLVGYRSVDGKDVTGYGPGNQKETFIWPGIKLTQGKQNELDKSGSITFHLTGKKKIQIEVKKENEIPEEIHFVCPANDCENACRGHHAEGHCYGFERLLHKCSHHCGPINRCAICKKDSADLCECKRCHKRFCDHCAYQSIRIEPRE